MAQWAKIRNFNFVCDFESPKIYFLRFDNRAFLNCGGMISDFIMLLPGRENSNVAKLNFLSTVQKVGEISDIFFHRAGII